jgi:hypothetical protein
MLEIKTSSIDKLKYGMEDTGFSMVLDEYGFPVILEPNKKRES